MARISGNKWPEFPEPTTRRGTSFDSLMPRPADHRAHDACHDPRGIPVTRCAERRHGPDESRNSDCNRFSVVATVLGHFCSADILTAQHNRKSVTPRLRLDLPHTVGTAQIKLVNAGVGPAVIQRFLVHVNGELIAPDERGQLAPGPGASRLQEDCVALRSMRR